MLVWYIRVRETQPIAQLGDAVFDLYAGVHLHEKVMIPLDDAFEGGHGIKTHRSAEASGLLLHALQDQQVLSQDGGLRGLPRRIGGRDRKRQLFFSDRDLEKLLLVHLQ